jgi:hypothetical protein
MDMNKMDHIRVDDLKLPPEVFALRLQRRAHLREAIEAATPDIDKAVENYNLDDYYQRALNLIISGRARKAFDLTQESEDARPLWQKHLRSKLPAGPAIGRSRHARRGSDLAQSRQLGLPLLGLPLRPDQRA